MGHVSDLHYHVKNLIDKFSSPWTYAILWECSSQRRVLKFKEGYHRGSGERNLKQVRIMGSCVSVVEDGTDYDAATEWFFKISKSQSFEINEDLPGHALLAPTEVWVNAEDRDWDGRYKWGMWERTKWAQQFGIRTFHCLPLQDKRVLELASTQIIPYDDSFEWISYNSHLIRPIGTVTQQQQQQQQVLLFFSSQQQQRQQQQLLLQQKQQIMAENELHRIRDADELNEEAVNEMKNHGKEKISEMNNRGKEKISDSKCSWTILTESSDRGTDRTFSCSHDYSGPS